MDANKIENCNFVQTIKMTPEEKFKMYMGVPHEDLVNMKIESERLMEIQDSMIENLRIENQKLKNKKEKEIKVTYKDIQSLDKYLHKFLYFNGYESGSDIIWIENIHIKDDKLVWDGVHIELTTCNSWREGVQIEYSLNKSFEILRYYGYDIRSFEDFYEWFTDKVEEMNSYEFKQILCRHLAYSFDQEVTEQGIDFTNPFKEYLD